MNMIDQRRNDRELLEKFCKINDLVGDFDFISYGWDEFLKPKLEKFLNDNGIDADPESYKFKCPIRFIIDKFSDKDAWNEYWKINSAKKENNEIINHIRNSYCGVGSRQVKKWLNSIPTTDSKILRLLLEIEDITISSSKYYGEFLIKNMDRRDKAISELNLLYHEFPEKVKISSVNDNMIVCDANIMGENEQFCWIIDNSERLNVNKEDSVYVSIKIYKEPKINRLEKLILRFLKNGKKL